jgi:hypothetical protein
MSKIPKHDNTLCYKEGMVDRWFFSVDGNKPIIEIDHMRMRIGSWYITLEAFEELRLEWQGFRESSSVRRIQG